MPSGRCKSHSRATGFSWALVWMSYPAPWHKREMLLQVQKPVPIKIHGWSSGIVAEADQSLEPTRWHWLACYSQNLPPEMVRSPLGRLSQGARSSWKGPHTTHRFSWFSGRQSRLGPSSLSEASHCQCESTSTWKQKPEYTLIHFTYVCQYFKEKQAR